MFDPTDPAFQADPYPTYARLQSESPIFRHEPWEMTCFTRFADVDALLRDRRLGRDIYHVLSRQSLGHAPPPPEEAPFWKMQAHSLMELEPPDHTRLKGLVHRAFTPRRVAALRERIATLCRELLERCDTTGEVDLLSAYAEPLAVTVIAELLGVPREDSARLRGWSHAITAMFELPRPADAPRRAVTAVLEFSDYLRRHIDARRQASRDDLLTALVQAEAVGEQLTEQELISTAILILNAGHEATVHALGNAVHALLRDPVQLAYLRRQPEIPDAAVEELLRYDTPLQLFRRWVLENFEYEGVRLEHGTEVALFFGAANRDPERFRHPQALDLTRNNGGHLSFGAGIHYCLGAPLARLELRVALETLLERFPELRPAARATYKPGFVFRGLQRLPVLLA